MHSVKTSILCLIVFLFLHASVAHAANKTTEPDPATNPVFAAQIKDGTKFFYLGRNHDLDGWLAIKDGQTQTAYTDTKYKNTFVGNLFAPDGKNISEEQVKHLKETNKNVAALTGAAKPDDVKPPVLSEEEKKDLALPAGERLLKELKKSPSLTLGPKSDAPTLFVVVAPGCKPCKDFWQSIRFDVQKGNLRVKLYMAGLKDTEDERASAMLLTNVDPLTAWNKYVDGNESALAGKPDKAHMEQVAKVTSIVEKWRFSTAPYILYRGKDGKVKVVQGVPADTASMLADVAPEKAEPKP